MASPSVPDRSHSIHTTVSRRGTTCFADPVPPSIPTSPPIHRPLVPPPPLPTSPPTLIPSIPPLSPRRHRPTLLHDPRITPPLSPPPPPNLRLFLTNTPFQAVLTNPHPPRPPDPPPPIPTTPPHPPPLTPHDGETPHPPPHPPQSHLLNDLAQPPIPPPSHLHPPPPTPPTPPLPPHPPTPLHKPPPLPLPPPLPAGGTCRRALPPYHMRESWLLFRLSPITQAWPAGTRHLPDSTCPEESTNTRYELAPRNSIHTSPSCWSHHRPGTAGGRRCSAGRAKR